MSAEASQASCRLIAWEAVPATVWAPLLCREVAGLYCLAPSGLQLPHPASTPRHCVLYEQASVNGR